MTAFIGACLSMERYYIAETVSMALEIKAYDVGENLGWHFDYHDAAISLLLQAPQEGGTFEYVPFMRKQGRDEAYEEVQKVFEGESSRVCQAANEAGCLLLFMGRESLHRVTPVTKGPTRLSALLCYHHEPGLTWSQERVDAVQKLGCRDFFGKGEPPKNDVGLTSAAVGSGSLRPA